MTNAEFGEKMQEINDLLSDVIINMSGLDAGRMSARAAIEAKNKAAQILTVCVLRIQERACDEIKKEYGL